MNKARQTAESNGFKFWAGSPAHNHRPPTDYAGGRVILRDGEICESVPFSPYTDMNGTEHCSSAWRNDDLPCDIVGYEPAADQK